MKGFFNKIGQFFRKLMLGRNGVDNLSYTTLWAGLICLVLYGFTGMGLFNLLGMALYVWTIFRVMSRNTAKRSEENRRYMDGCQKIRVAVSQWWQRVKNIRKYKYFRCPQCKARLRMKRGSGKKDVSCPKCKHSFSQKA